MGDVIKPFYKNNNSAASQVGYNYLKKIASIKRCHDIPRKYIVTQSRPFFQETHSFQFLLFSNEHPDIAGPCLVASSKFYYALGNGLQPSYIEFLVSLNDFKIAAKQHHTLMLPSPCFPVLSHNWPNLISSYRKHLLVFIAA